MPVPNAFTIWREADQIIPDSALGFTNNPREFVTSNTAAFRLFAEGLTNDCQAPLAQKGLSGVNSFRKLALALRLKARMFEAEGQWERAAETYLQILQLGEGIEHGALIHLLVGMTIEKIGLAGLKPVLSRLDLQERKVICGRLEVMNRNRIRFQEVQDRDRYFQGINEPNSLKRLWYAVYWHITFLGLHRAPDVGEKYRRLVAEIEETARAETVH
jgi:hypothetical protein